MTSISLTDEEARLLCLLIERELKDFASDEPLQADPLTMKGEAGYEQFLTSLLDKVKAVQKKGKR